MWRSLWRQAGREKWAYFFLALPLAHFLLFRFSPILRAFELSFQRFDVFNPEWVGLDNYRAIAGDPVFWTAIKNTLAYTIGVVPASIAISLFLATLIFPLSFALQTFFKGAYYLPGVASAAVLSLVWSWIFHPAFGLLNYFLAFLGVEPVRWLADPRTAMPSIILMSLVGGQGASIIMLMAAMGSIPPALYESARLDGATRRREFWHITLPLIKPTLVYLLIISTINSFQVFTNIYIMTRGGPGYVTTTIVYTIFQRGFERMDFGLASAQAVVLFLMTVVLAIVQYYWLTSDVEY
jgi:multiple sugar transport system permease protein